MKTSDFFYQLPPSHIAQKPLEKRDHSRLMILDRRKEKPKHKKFFEIEEHLTENDLLVLNNTKVIPARLIVKKVTGGKVEILLLKKLEDLIYEVLLGGAGKIKERDSLILPDGLKTCTLIQKLGGGKWLAKFDFSSQTEFDEYLYKYEVLDHHP